MSKRITYEEAYKIFKENGYELLDKEYNKSSTKMTCVDGEGYKYFLQLDSLKKDGKKSRFCNNNPYTDYNIDNLLKIRNCGYIRITNDIKSTKQDIDLIDTEGYKYRVKVTSLISKSSKFTAIGNNNYWSIFNMNKYLSDIQSTDTLLTTKFVKQSENLDWMCKEGHLFHTNWNNYHSKGFRCMECARISKMYTFEQCEQIVSKRNGYSLLRMERRKNIHGNDVIYYLVKHECGHEYWVNKQEFDIGKSCKPCVIKRNGVNKRLSHEEIVARVESIEGYKLISTSYRNGRCYIKVLHESCGRIACKSLSNWTSGYRCMHCSYSEGKKLPKEEWIRRIEDISEHNFKLSKILYKKRNDGIGNEAHLEIKCMNCKKTFTRASNGWKNGCPYCSNSKGEEKTRKFLVDRHINFIPQKEYDGLLGVGFRNLSYDFFLPDYNVLIEYQGEFHDGSNHGLDKSYLPTQQEHDRGKRKYAKDNNINLLEIWYWDFDNIEEILTKELNL